MTLTLLNNTLYSRIDPDQVRRKVLVLLCRNVEQNYDFLYLVGPVFVGAELVWYHLFTLHRFDNLPARTGARLILSGPASHHHFLKKHTEHQFEVLAITRLRHIAYQTIINVAMAHQHHTNSTFFDRIYTYLCNRYADPHPSPPHLLELLLQAL